MRRGNRCSALYPNLFAGKFKDEYERERRRLEREREKTEESMGRVGVRDARGGREKDRDDRRHT